MMHDSRLHASPHGSGNAVAAHDVHEGPLFRRLWDLAQYERADIWLVFLYAVAVGILSLATPIVVMLVVNTTAMASLAQQLLVLVIGLMVALSLAAVLRVLQMIVVEFIQQRVFVRVVTDLSHRLPRVDITAFDQAHGPELVNRFFDVLTVQKSASTLLLDGITIVLQVIIGMVLLGFYHQYLLGFDLFLLIGIILIFVLGIGAIRRAIAESWAKYAVANWMEEIARHPLAFKLGGGTKLAFEQSDDLTTNYLKCRQAHFQIVKRQVAFSLALQVAANGMLLAVGGYLVINQQLSLGQLVAAEIVVSMVVASFTKLGKQLESFYDLIAALSKLGVLMDLPLERDTGGELPVHPEGASITFHDIGFHYPDSHRMILRQFSERIEPGQRVALIGRNGSGKTTLAELLFGLREPDYGHIEINSMDLRDVKLDDYRLKAALVGGVEIFSGSVLQNLQMGRSIPVEDIRAGLASVGLLDDILALPQGLQTELRTGGRPLSLGQAKRLVVARAILDKPQLLIIDELLDDLDETSRRIVLPVILNRQAPWTLVVTTHSEALAELCDKSIHLPEGKVS
jgi:ABC-type bacteriocin/lantibiotic exporter with double-glycine peptidase domain